MLRAIHAKERVPPEQLEGTEDLEARPTGLSESVDEASDLGGSSWLNSDSAYDGTGLRVRSRDSMASLFAEHEGGLDEEEDRSSDGSDSELTALAARPPAVTGNDLRGESGEHSYASGASYPSDDMVTPSLATASLAGMNFGRHLSPEPPLTLASYLASTLSSPKTRSQSSSSLASFPTDLMSDISRGDSVVDTDDAASEFNSDNGDLGHPRDATMRQSNNELVMPRLHPRTTSSGASSDTTSSSERQARQEVSERPVGGEIQDLRVLMVGGSESENKKLKKILRRKAKHNQPILRSDPAAASESAQIMPGTASFRSRLSSSAVSEEGAAPTPLRDMSSKALSVEMLPDLAAATARVLRPFLALESVLRPGAQTSENKLVDEILPSLLGKVAGIDACLLFLKPEKGISLAQHVSVHYLGLRKLSKLTTLVPILNDRDAGGEVDAASQLTQGDIEFWGLTQSGSLVSLRKGGQPFRFSMEERHKGSLALAMRFDGLRQRSVSAYRRWILSEATGRPDMNRTGTARSRPASSASESIQSSSADQLESLDPPSLTSSMIESLTLPPTSRDSNESSTEALVIQPIEALPVPTSPNSPSTCLDPLHLPSLLHLVGLNLASVFRTFRSSIAIFLLPRQRSMYDIADAEEKPSSPVAAEAVTTDDPAIAAHQAASPAGSQFIRCCTHRYRPAGSNETVCNSPMYRCRGLILVSLIFGVTFFFS